MYLILILILLIVLVCINHIDSQESFNPNEKYKLCIMAIFKDEQLYLEEWLLYHINQGISHFYLYSNDEKMHNYPYLSKYDNYITLIPWTDKTNNESGTIQIQAYTHCARNYGHECLYLMMLDIDEFIISLEKNKTVSDIMDSLDYATTEAIKVQRYDFGSDGHKNKPDGNVMDNYLKHEQVCSSYKTIANTSYIDLSKTFFGVHDFPFIDKPGKIYNEYFNYKHKGYPNGCEFHNKNEIPLVINHYYTKSYDEYLKRCSLWKDGGVNNIGYRKNCESLFNDRDRNEIIDYDYLKL
jgi:hypothetical protein